MGRRAFLLSGIALLVIVALVRLADPLPVQQVRSVYFDYLQRLSPREPADLPVRVVDIDEASLAALGQWPWPRHLLALMVERLSEAGAAAIIFDVIFAEPDRLSLSSLANEPALAEWFERSGLAGSPDLPDNDAIFARAMRERGVVLGVADIRQGGGDPALAIKSGAVEIGDSPSSGLPRTGSLTGIVPVLAEAADGIGIISTNPYASSSVVRAVPVMWRTEAGLLPALSMEALRVALGESTYVLHGSNVNEGVVEALRVGAFEVPTTSDGLFLVRYRPDDPALYVPAHQVLDGGTDLRAAVEGQIVLIGTSAAGLLDIRTTALGESVPGVSIHAQMLEQVLLGDFLYRSDFVAGMEFLSFILVGSVVLGVMANFGPVLSLGSGLAAGAATAGVSWFAFRDHGILFGATFALIGGTVIFGGVFALQHIVADREKRMIRRSFAHYVAPEVLAEIEKSGHDLKLGGVVQDVTVMFADIRDFTPLSETMDAAELVALLNELFTDLGESILRQQGTIDKFIGDALMAFWNAPLPIEDHRRKACLAALGMREAIAELNMRKGIADTTPVKMAIGLSSGPACVGNIGSRDRFNYSAIGDTVNAAARVETSCRRVGCEVLVSADIVEAAEGLAFLDAGRIALKGKSGRTPVSVLVGDETLAARAEFRALAECHQALLVCLREPGEGVEEMLDRCRDLAGRLDRRLLDFYERIAGRGEDFRQAANEVERA